MENNDMTTTQHHTPMLDSEDRLFDVVARLIDQSRKQVAKAVNTAIVYTYYAIGQYVVEFEQGGNKRAGYGKEVLKRLSEKLTERYGSGWSVETLTKCRNFYSIYSISSPLETISDDDAISEPVVRKLSADEKSSTLQTKSDTFEKSATVSQISEADEKSAPVVRKSESDTKSAAVLRKSPQFRLPWSHYIILMREKNPDARRFYEIEAFNQQWSKRQLQRQVASSLYERLALSRNKEEVMRLANEGQTIEKPIDILKNPLVLEFIGLKPDAAYSESKLEGAIISKLQDFLLECGKGFLFEARQKRFTFDEDHFYVDLVLYNRLLQCYVLVDIKVDKLTHQDLGQMQMYVNYFDRYVKQEFEKPTIGILLCKTKSDALVELTLPKDAQIYAQQYALCLPKKEELQQHMRQWIHEYNQAHHLEEEV